MDVDDSIATRYNLEENYEHINFDHYEGGRKPTFKTYKDSPANIRRVAHMSKAKPTVEQVALN